MTTEAFRRNVQKLIGHYGKSKHTMAHLNAANDYFVGRYARMAIERMTPAEIQEFRGIVGRLSGNERALIMSTFTEI